MENIHIIEIFFRWKPKLRKPTYSIFIHIIHCLQYHIHIGSIKIQNPNPMNCISHVGPRPSFEEILVRFDHFLDFDAVIEEGVPRRS
jgi:hypothetical protein